MQLLKVWSNRKKILEGITNSVFQKQHVELIAQERMEICNACPHIDRQGDKCLAPGSQPCCSLCGCKLAWKTRALSDSCGDKANPRWHALVTEEDEDQIKKQLNISDNEAT
jgi:hypothetical protein